MSPQDQGMSAIGYVILAVLWSIIVIVLKRAVVDIVRSTRLSDLKPRIIRVPNCHGVAMVSGQRASFNPAQFIRVTPWCWRKRT